MPHFLHVLQKHIKGPAKKSTDSRYADFLPGTLAITARPPASFANIVISLSGLFLATTILWMAFAQVDEIATGNGKVRPAGHVQIINHPTGGKISAILVKPGDHVERGQILIKLDPESATEEAEKLGDQKNTLIAETIRLEAELKQPAAPVFPDDLKQNTPKLVENQLALFKARMEEREHQRAVAKSEIDQRTSEVTQSRAKARNSLNSFQLAEKEEAATKELTDKGYYPKLRFLSMQRDVAAAKSDSEQSSAALETAQSALAAAHAKAKQIDSDGNSKVLAELNERRTDLAKISHQLDAIVSARNNLELKSPVAGYVEDIKVANVGQAIGSGQEIMHIVPEEDSLLIDARINNRDIGHITEGQDATIKLMAFDYQRFGMLNGKVFHVPQDSEVDEKTGEVYFTVVIKPLHNYLGAVNDPHYSIHPGMIGSVELHLGQRSILSYFLDTLLRYKDEAFREY